MLHISFFLKDIDRQISEFVDHKKNRSLPVAKQAEEHLRMFKKIVRRKSVYEVDDEDVTKFSRWLWDHYPSNYMVKTALKSLSQFLRFFRSGVKIKTNRG